MKQRSNSKTEIFKSTICNVANFVISKMVTVLTNRRKSIPEYLKETYRYRHLIFTFAFRDIKKQYAQTLLGILWSAIQPLTGLLIFTLFFDRLINIDTHGIPYPLFAFSGMVSWYYFTHLMGHAGNAIVQEQDIITKVYFPKLILPLSKVLVGFLEFIISFVFLLVLMLIMGRIPGINLLFLPLFIILIIICGLSVGIWLSALTVRYRDFQHIIPYIVNFGIWLTPVFYPSTLIPEQYEFLLAFNPMAGIIAGFRWSLLGDTIPDITYLFGFIPIFILFITGLAYFIKIEKQIPDLV